MITELGPVNSEAYWRGELSFATALLERMPRRRRNMFVSHVVNGLTFTEVAALHGVAKTTVQRELLAAFELCAEITAKAAKRART